VNDLDFKRSPASLKSSSAARLEELLAEFRMKPMDSGIQASFDAYLDLILKWNARTNLTAVRDGEGILRRHFIECIACAQHLPNGIETLLDFGSGAGFPGIPIAIFRREIAVTLAESQNKKAAFLREAISILGLKAKVFRGRAETLSVEFDCVAIRAVDRMERAVIEAMPLIRPGGILALMTTRAEFPKFEKLLDLRWQDGWALPGSDQRVLRLGAKT
jgi:16S rRNA (guanine527-N7)-methyltransferase